MSLKKLESALQILIVNILKIAINCYHMFCFIWISYESICIWFSYDYHMNFICKRLHMNIICGEFLCVDEWRYIKYRTTYLYYKINCHYCFCLMICTMMMCYLFLVFEYYDYYLLCCDPQICMNVDK